MQNELQNFDSAVCARDSHFLFHKDPIKINKNNFNESHILWASQTEIFKFLD